MTVSRVNLFKQFFQLTFHRHHRSCQRKHKRPELTIHNSSQSPCCIFCSPHTPTRWLCEQRVYLAEHLAFFNSAPILAAVSPLEIQGVACFFSTWCAGISARKRGNCLSYIIPATLSFPQPCRPMSCEGSKSLHYNYDCNYQGKIQFALWQRQVHDTHTFCSPRKS